MEQGRLKPFADLDFLLDSLETASGVDPRRLKFFKKLLGPRVIDAVFHLPTNLITRRYIDTIDQAQPDELISITATAVDYALSTRRGSPTKITCYDGKNHFDLIFFQGNGAYYKKLFPLTAKRRITGKLDKKSEKSGFYWQIAHPEITMPIAVDNKATLCVEPVYPLTAGITNKCVTRVISPLLRRLPLFPDWIDPVLKQQHHWPEWQDALRSIHTPKTQTEICTLTPARERLIYDELLAHQLSVNLLRVQQECLLPGQSMVGTGDLGAKIMATLPYTLTPSQDIVLKEIYQNMTQSTPMLRLLQGDVGSGKTLVALLAMARAVESGYQAAILAPTDILARQHGQTIIEIAEKFGLRTALLTGREKGKKRDVLLADLKDHKIDILIGTHAIIQDTVIFAKLGLAVVDEQHRFGVEQRLALTQKGENPDVLTMTATPIPRTLMLANYGDMDVSFLREKPAGRQPVTTKVMALTRLEEVIAGITTPLKSGTKIFWVCPLVEESEALDLAATEERYIHLTHIFGEKVGIVHGKMKAADKDTVMENFINGNIDLLVATTVIEVGVNVPAATVMVIEHAERFGLAQLHQLRGRIGRGENPATCLLLYGFPLSEIGRKRLEIMRQSNDGFLLAEEDLKLRGGGDILGTRQSGLPGFRMADFTSNPDKCQALLSLAHKDARLICRNDPNLQSPRGQALRLLLRLFNREDAIKYSRS